MKRIGFINYIRNDMKAYRLMTYQEEYSAEAKKIGDEKRILSAEEHSAMSELDFSSHYKSKESLIKWYYNYISNIDKVELIPAVIKYVYANSSNIRRIVSFGAGSGVLEYFISLILQDDVNIIATDYDAFLVKKGNELLGEKVEFQTFDFYKDTVEELVAKNGKIDLAIMIGSACSMDNETHRKFLVELRENGIERIITFEAGVKSRLFMLKKKLQLLIHAIARWILKIDNRELKACHAYQKSISEVKRIYNAAGYKYKSINSKAYKYGFLLESKER